MAIDIRKPLKKMLPHLLQARDANLNEADTVQRLIKVFEEVLGYDGMTDISREAQMKNKYVDVALKVDGVIRLLVEAKAAGETLRERHIEQTENYAAKNNYRWALLTNGVSWNLYYVTCEGSVESVRAFQVDLANAEEFEANAEKLALLHKQAIKKGELDEFWRMKTALSPASIGKALMQEGVLSLIRREIRREEGLLIDIEDLAASIQKMLSAEAREQIGPMKIRKKRATPKRKNEVVTAEVPVPPEEHAEVKATLEPEAAPESNLAFPVPEAKA